MSKVMDLGKINDMRLLTTCEREQIDGGGFWGDVFFVGAAAVHFVGYMLADAHNNPIRPSEYR